MALARPDGLDDGAAASAMRSASRYAEKAERSRVTRAVRPRCGLQRNRSTSSFWLHGRWWQRRQRQGCGWCWR
eukprot:6657473-Pyramimonas_sp.AAC.1